MPTREILRRHPLTWVILLTSAPHGQLATQAIAAGARACLAKSGRYSALVNVIHAA
jgi:DNA-binding NarL/FixJ family response regulator